jgi:hypothetical protein
LATYGADCRRLIVGDLGAQRVPIGLEHISVKSRLPGLQPGQQFEIKALDQRALQQDLLLAPQILDVERGPGTVGQARAEVFRTEVIVPATSMSVPCPRRTEGDHAVDNILIRNDGARVDVAAIDVEQGELTTDLSRSSVVKLSDIGIDDPGSTPDRGRCCR